MTRDRKNFFARLLIPQYDQLTLFLMVLAFVLLVFTHANLRARLFSNPYSDYLFFGVVVTLYLYYVFTPRRKTDHEKAIMLFLAVFVNGWSGVAAGMHMLKDFHGLLVVFPVWNIANGVLLLLMFRFRIIDESSIIDENATLPQFLLGSVIVVAAFAICTFVFKMYWAITFSICVSYAANVNEMVQSLFFGFRQGKGQQNKSIEPTHDGGPHG